jgi:hypothetical protein
MSGKMGSGASHILEGIKRKTVKDAQVEVIRDESITAEPHNVNVSKLETDKQINVNVLREAIYLALNKKQRISVWAPDIALIMWYLKLSTPMFSISDVAKKYIAEGLKRDHPELYSLAKEELNKSH